MTAGRILRPLTLLLLVLIGWRALVALEVAPRFLLPAPEHVLLAMWTKSHILGPHIFATVSVALIGYRIGSWFGVLNALTLARSERARRWLLPLLVGGQAAPVFALGPLLTLWLGYGPAAKIVMTALVVYFPVTASFYYGLSSVDPRLIEIGRVMGADARTELWRLRVPAAAPALASGLRMAAVFAPISALVGEMTGSAVGLGYLMKDAIARGKPELAFAALFALALFGVLFHALVRYWTARATSWAPEAAPAH
ncbi:MAG: ABC transporter permease [Neomegalonema sp.]|nr:ABC transporter permease [Neomegalonema sp.]